MLQKLACHVEKDLVHVGVASTAELLHGESFPGELTLMENFMRKGMNLLLFPATELLVISLSV